MGHLSPGGGSVATKRLGKHVGRAHKMALDMQSPACFFSCGEDGLVTHFDLRDRLQTSEALVRRDAAKQQVGLPKRQHL